MADIRLNFNSQWPSIQVAKVIPYNSGEWEANPLANGGMRAPHGLGYPPLSIWMSSGAMNPLTVDEEYVYRGGEGDAVVYSLDISKPITYPKYPEMTGDIPEGYGNDDVDLRKFLLHSRATSPMVYSVVTKEFTMQDTELTYSHDLGYPIFNFGYLRMNMRLGPWDEGLWVGLALRSQGWPSMPTDGITSTVDTATSSGSVIANIGSIITLRNPYIATGNTVEVTV